MNMVCPEMDLAKEAVRVRSSTGRLSNHGSDQASTAWTLQKNCPSAAWTHEVLAYFGMFSGKFGSRIALENDDCLLGSFGFVYSVHFLYGAHFVHMHTNVLTKNCFRHVEPIEGHHITDSARCRSHFCRSHRMRRSELAQILGGISGSLNSEDEESWKVWSGTAVLMHWTPAGKYWADVVLTLCFAWWLIWLLAIGHPYSWHLSMLWTMA